MNRPIFRVYVIVLLLFLPLVGFTSFRAVWDAEGLEADRNNRRPLITEQQIPRGDITTSDGVLVAESVPQGGGRRPVYVRRYPQGELFGHPVGYSYVDVGRSEIELAENDLLSGEENEFATIIDQLRDQQPEGADLTLTLNAEAQRVATQQLEAAVSANSGAFPQAGGAVVALEPATGAVRVMASYPGFDPNRAQDDEALAEINTAENSPIINRPTQAEGYPPGSTMKVVTAAAGIDSGTIDADTVINADSPKQISGFPLQNFGDADFGDIDAIAALTNSVNTYWAQVGERIGSEEYYEYMERFGFNSDPELDFPDSAMTPSGVIDLETGGVRDADDAVDIGRVAIGQGDLSATPLQMAEVAATIANEGTLMRPTFLQEAKDPDGRTIEELDPDEQQEVVSDETAEQVKQMMVNVTEDGTAAGLSVGGVQFGGKTGTAELDVEADVNQPWFIGFAPADDPQIAVAATIERCQGCTGGEVAGPIATAVMESLLAGG